MISQISEKRKMAISLYDRAGILGKIQECRSNNIKLDYVKTTFI
jgi:hypothetical protein